MKSYNHLYEIYVSEKNIRISIVTGTKNHRDKQPYKDMFENPDDYIKKSGITQKHLNQKNIILSRYTMGFRVRKELS